METVAPSLYKAVRNVLHAWHHKKHDLLPWNQLLLVAQHKQRQPIPDHDLAVKQVLLEALAELEEQGNGEQAQVLRVRFLDELTIRETAARLNISVDMVNKRQRKGLENLATIIWQAEKAALDERAVHIAKRLEIQEPPPLFGVDDKQAELLARLTAAGPPWLVAVVGIGGIGKTSLADAVVRILATSPAFADIAWVSARQEQFTFWRGLEPPPNARPALTFEGLLEAIIEQFDFQDLGRLPARQKQHGLQARFKDQPHLVVIDNLESAADYEALIPDLQGLVNPTRFLLTGRRSLHDYPGVYNLSLDELSAADSLALLRHEAGQRGLADVAAASDEILWPVYEVAGGNPLALKLLVGQMHTLSLSKVVEDLQQARGQTVEELYRYIYWRSWNLLGDEARRVLTVMPLLAESGGGLEQIAALSELAAAPLAAALKQLVALCLVNVRGTVQARRYSIHRLTETFLLNEVLKWQTPS